MSRPFDSARFAALLEGLDATVLKLTELRVDNDPFRLDSEFHAKVCLSAVVRVKGAAMGAEQFGECGPSIIHPQEIVRSYVEEGGVWFFRAQNVRLLGITDTNKVFISHRDAAQLRHNSIQREDVLITRTGANRGDCALFDSDEPAIASSHTFIVRNERWNQTFLAAFLSCQYGRLQIDKGVYGAAQPEVAPYYLRRIWIPKVSKNFQEYVALAFQSAAHERATSHALLAVAEDTLTAALGLTDWQPPEPLTYTRRAGEALAAGRIDAEYWHPAKAGYLLALAELPGRPLGIHYRAVREMFDPAKAPRDQLVRNFDLTHALQPVLDDTTTPTLVGEIGSAKKRLAPGDLAVSRLRHYLREIALVRTSEAVPAIGSSEFIVLRRRDDSPLPVETLLVFLRSHPVQTILKWSQDGSHHPRFDDNDLLSIPVPDAVCDAAPAIGVLIETVLAARHRARGLLAAAQRAVEIAIEEGETAALRFLEAHS